MGDALYDGLVHLKILHNRFLITLYARILTKRALSPPYGGRRTLDSILEQEASHVSFEPTLIFSSTSIRIGLPPFFSIAARSIP